MALIGPGTRHRSRGSGMKRRPVTYRAVGWLAVAGLVAGAPVSGNHVEGSSGCNGGTPVQLLPYDDTPNSGGEYSVDLAPADQVAACDGLSAVSTTLNFVKDCSVASKNDNYKVGATASTP